MTKGQNDAVPSEESKRGLRFWRRTDTGSSLSSPVNDTLVEEEEEEGEGEGDKEESDKANTESAGGDGDMYDSDVTVVQYSDFVGQKELDPVEESAISNDEVSQDLVSESDQVVESKQEASQAADIDDNVLLSEKEVTAENEEVSAEDLSDEVVSEVAKNEVLADEADASIVDMDTPPSVLEEQRRGFFGRLRRNPKSEPDSQTGRNSMPNEASETTFNGTDGETISNRAIGEVGVSSGGDNRTLDSSKQPREEQTSKADQSSSAETYRANEQIEIPRTRRGLWRSKDKNADMAIQRPNEVVDPSENTSNREISKNDKEKRNRIRRLLVPVCFAFIILSTSNLPWDEYVSDVSAFGSSLIASGLSKIGTIVQSRQKLETVVDDHESGPPQESQMTPLERRKEALSYVKEAVQKVWPSVLRIDIKFMQEDEGRPMSPHPLGGIQEEQGQGSGVIVSPNGLVVTNAHVVEGAQKVTVTLTDGRVMEAEVKGVDEIVDVAVLQILPREDGETVADMPVADFGDSDELDVGQMVIAVGTPGGLDNTVTMGIVSGLDRPSTMVGVPLKKVNYIQTDAAINPGNSGGPLVDVESGRVVGISACIRSNMEGTSFAIPINRVRAILDDLSVGKEVNHGYIGISMATCTPDWARQNNKRMGGREAVPEVYGAIIATVFPGTPGDLGGLKENDVIIDIGGKPIRSTDEAKGMIDAAPIGKDLRITVVRDQRTIELIVRPGDLAARLRQRRMMEEQLKEQDVTPFRSLLQ